MTQEKKEQYVSALTEHDKQTIGKQFNLIALRIPCNNIGKLGHSLKPYTFQRKGTKPFQLDPQNIINPLTNKPQFKCLLLCESIKTKELETIPSHLIQLINECDAETIEYPLTLDYNKLSALEVLRQVINDDAIELPTHFETVGHIVHFKLREELLKYKYIIAQVYLDKLSKSIKTIVNKTGNIENEFRVCPIELIGGIHNYETMVKENQCSFAFDLSTVYWNSRLGTEHQRMCDTFGDNHIICDMMAGVGPFVVPAAKNKQCIVYANDLNPNSFKYLKHNCQINKVENNVKCYNMDGRAFWKHLCENKHNIAQQNGELLVDMNNKNQNKFMDHIIMNLPAIAIEFLDVFRECYDLKEIEQYGLPMIHCYCFATDENPEKSIYERLEKYLGMVPIENNLKMRLVRNVAPHKDYYCVSFRLPKEVALHSKERCANSDIDTNSDINEPPLKKHKADLSQQ